MKKLLLTIVFGLIGLINFGYCETVEDLLDVEIHTINNITLPNSSQFNAIVDFGDITDGTICVKFYNFSHTVDLKIGAFNSTNTNTISRSQWYYYWAGWEGNYTCYVAGPVFHYLVADVDYNSNITFDLDYFFMNNFLSTNIPVMTSIQCQTEYNLIPISSVNQNYCVNNGLCPSCPDNPIGTGNWSALYINNIQHLSAPIINVDIPEEFDWDYTNTGGIFDLSIDGYNTDADYIAGIITTQNSKPTNEDLNNIITNVIPLFVPGLVIILFIYFVFRFLKKIF